MKIVDYKEIQKNVLGIPGAKDVAVRLAVGAEDGAQNFIMMVLEIAPGGNTPFHHHAWEEEIFIKSGSGKLKTADTTLDISEGTVLFFKGDEPHQFINTGSSPLEAICVIPKR